MNNSSGGKKALKGDIYHVKLLMLFFIASLFKRYNFKLRKEMKTAQKFDDIVFEETKNNRNEFTLIQVKHKDDESVMIDFDSLITDGDTDFSLVKYFFSLKDSQSVNSSKVKNHFNKKNIKNVVLFTNINLGNNTNKIAKQNVKDFVVEINNEDGIVNRIREEFKMTNKSKKMYKVTEKIIQFLKPLINSYVLRRLARELVKNLLQNEGLRAHQGTFKDYHVILAEKVIDVTNKTFYDDFLNGTNLDEDTEAFRKQVEQELRKQSNKEYNTLAGFKERFAIKLKLSKHFGQGDNEGWKTEPISYQEIQDFISKLILAVDQPNVIEIEVITKEYIRNIFESETTEIIYNKLYAQMLDWLSKEGKHSLEYYSLKEGVDFFKGIIGNAWFGMTGQLKSFSGRSKELDELHDLVNRDNKQFPSLTLISESQSATGLGGLGKTELARQYSYLYSKEYDRNVVWIDAANYATLVRSFKEFAKRKLKFIMVDHTGTEKSISTIIHEVYSLFFYEKVLFVFDNAERNYMTSKDSNERVNIEMFLPISVASHLRHHVIITSRDQILIKNIDTLLLKLFNENDTEELFRYILEVEGTSLKKLIQTLAKKLNYFPLALNLAAVNIKQNMNNDLDADPKDCINEYLRKYEEKDQELMAEDNLEILNDPFTKTAYLTWEITLDSIKNMKAGAKAIEILNSAACLESLESNNPVTISQLDKDSSTNDCNLISAVELLRKYSMVDSGEDKSIIHVHRLLQRVTLLRLAQRGEHQIAIAHAVEAAKVASRNLTEDQQEYARILFKAIHFAIYGINYAVQELERFGNNLTDVSIRVAEERQPGFNHFLQTVQDGVRNNPEAVRDLVEVAKAFQDGYIMISKNWRK